MLGWTKPYGVVEVGNHFSWRFPQNPFAIATVLQAETQTPKQTLRPGGSSRKLSTKTKWYLVQCPRPDDTARPCWTRPNMSHEGRPHGISFHRQQDREVGTTSASQQGHKASAPSASPSGGAAHTEGEFIPHRGGMAYCHRR